MGSRGPQVQLLQLALERAGYSPGNRDGSFGPRTQRALVGFQASRGLMPDGVAGSGTHAALRPWYTGFAVHTVRPGDSLYRISLRYGASLRALTAANPEADPLNLRPGQRLTVPLDFDVVPTDIDWCSETVAFCCQGLAARYPMLERYEIGRSVLDRPLWLLTLGEGEHRVLWNAVHHANEWITAPLLLRFTEELARALALDEPLDGLDAGALTEGTVLAVVPCLNPDGMDLVTGDLSAGAAWEGAAEIARGYPAIPFPAGWKANLRGVDLNLQYPAGWELAREIKYAQGFTGPAPRDYVGPAPLSAPESLALHHFTLGFSPDLTLSYHTQGQVIYWRFLDYEVPGAEEIALRFARSSGYLAEDTPYASGFAGYKDWFIQDFRRPGYTIEAGIGDNPLPVSQFGRIYRDNFGILAYSLAAAKSL